MNLPEIPAWWPEREQRETTHEEKFTTYIEYHPIRHSVNATVYMKVDGRGLRLDYEQSAENLDRFWENCLLSIIKDVLELTDRPDGWPGMGGHWHLIWADREQEHLDSKASG